MTRKFERAGSASRGTLVLGSALSAWALVGSCTTPQMVIDASVIDTGPGVSDTGSPDSPPLLDAPGVDAPASDVSVDTGGADAAGDAGCENRFGTAMFGVGCFG